MAGKIITLKYDGNCYDCGAFLPAGTRAKWYGRGKRRGSCNGGGYDLQGTAFGENLEKEWTDRLNALALANLDKLPQYEGGVNLNVNKTDKAFYGMSTIFKGGKFHHVNLDGACGFNCMVRKVHSSSKLDIIDTQGE